jgi:hypothetical protein
VSESDLNTGVITQRNNSGFVFRLWRGEIPLVKTYWIYGCLVGLVIRLISPALTYILVANSQSLSAFDVSFISYLWVLITVLYSVFILIAIWRSANKYELVKPTRRGNAGLAKASVIVGAIILTGRLAEMALDYNSLPSSSSSSSQMQLQATLAGLNANLPKTLDNISRLSKIDFKNNSFVYYISISIAISDRQSFVTKMQSSLKETCNNKYLSGVLKSNINIEYVYSDTVTQNFADITIKRSDCPNL